MTISVSQVVLGYFAGSLTTLSPCVLPILPFVLGGAILENKLAPFAISCGLVTSFVIIGWPIAAFGAFLGFDQTSIRIFAGVALVISGFVILSSQLQEMMAKLLTPFSSRAETHLQKSTGNGKRDLKAQFVTGLFLGAIWSPCTGPIMGSAVGMAAQEGGGLSSGLIMLFFGLGAVSPLLAMSYGAKTFLLKSKAKLFAGVNVSKKVFGGLMIFIGLSIVFGIDKKLESILVEHMPDSWVDLTTRF